MSVDATPVQMDSVGKYYGHSLGGRVSEYGKARWYTHVLQRAAGVVAWSDWAADSLVADYGVQRDRVLVAHPGASESFFAIQRSSIPDRKPRILFVGSDFERKGGEVLLKAFRQVADRAELVIVTDANVPPTPGLVQERGVTPGSDRLVAAYADSDVFCLPTLADCTPVAIGEALASGLPVVTTRVGSNAQTVRDGTSGLLTRAGDVDDLAVALRRLVDQGEERREMGRRAREDAQDRFHSDRNAMGILDLLRTVAS